MATGINLLADQADQATGDLDVRLTAATREIALEKGTLESVLFAIVDGVVVCNENLQIVLSNAAARRLAGRAAQRRVVDGPAP
jgi:signal transduction histidine kinase